ncbi:MAG: hypothetical protein FJ293_03200 [Planctomycetes bacterium]|nr:hypothetical protein [Planctomycetota bacterium]
MKIAFTLMACLLAACGGPPHQAREKSSDRLAAVDASTMVVLDHELRFTLELLDHRVVRLPDGRLRAQIRIANRTGSDLKTQVAWTFKDDSNFAVESETPFEHVLFGAGQTRDLTRESLSNAATRFHVQARTAKPGEF